MKACSCCRENKPYTDYHKNSSKKDGYHHRCKACCKVYYKKWQEISPDRKRRMYMWQQEKKAAARSFIVEYLQSHPCVDCGNSDIRLLVFDHVRDKKVHGVMTMINRGNTLEVIKKEISKCEVRCYNCHALVTAARGEWWLSKLSPDGRETIAPSCNLGNEGVSPSQAST